MTSSTPRFSRLIWLETPDCIKTAEPEELDLSSLHLINQNKTERSLFYLSLQTVNVLWVFFFFWGGGGGFLVEVEKIFLYFIALDTHFILPLPHQSLSLAHFHSLIPVPWFSHPFRPWVRRCEEQSRGTSKEVIYEPLQIHLRKMGVRGTHTHTHTALILGEESVWHRSICEAGSLYWSSDSL